jgi:acetylornithine deacetylase/succinyl-diaminopimelate desuccinylase-like protein
VGALATVLAGYRADAALITEPTRLRLVPAQAGSLVFRLTVTGSSVHAAARRAASRRSRSSCHLRSPAGPRARAYGGHPPPPLRRR